MGKMKSAYVICALLGLTIGTLANDMTQPANKINSPTSNSTAELAKYSSNGTTPVPLPSTETSSDIGTTSKTTVTSSTAPSTTATTAVPPNSTTSTITPPTPPTTTTSTTTPLPTPKTTTSPVTSTTTAASKTTAIPTSAPSSHKDREFDGLSFFGGIVLTTCLMAIAAFSWRFYRQCKDGSYRTL